MQATLRHWRNGLVALLAVLPAFACAATHASPPMQARYRVIGYATAWNPAQDKDVARIDTLIFAFGEIKHGHASLTPEAKARLQTLIALKARNPALRVDVSIGGWGAGGFSEAARTPAARMRFARSTARLVTAQHADGIDIDWEYPGRSDSGIASSPDDRAHFTLLLASVRHQLDVACAAQHRRCTLSIAVADGLFAKGVDIAAVNRYVDWFNLMTYDFCNSMTPTTCHHTGLHASHLAPANARTTARAVRQFLAAGVPPHKLVIGVAYYGREFGAATTTHDGLYQPYAKYVGEIPWPKLATSFINHNGFVRHWDAQADAAWLWNAKSHTFISYDDPASIAAKAAFVKTHHLGGIMYWEQSLDPTDTLLDAIASDLR